MSYGIRKSFYHSKAWKDVKRAVWLKQNLLCNRCHRPVYVYGLCDYVPKESRRTGIVHHKIYLDDINVYDDTIALDEENLEGICKECHDKEHLVTTITRSEYEFDETGMLIKK